MRGPTLALLGLALASPALAASAPAAPQKGWRQLATPNFRVIGNAGEGGLRRAALRLEQFRDALGILFPKAVLVSSAPTTVIVFRGDKEYEPFKPLYKGKAKEISGYFLPGRTSNYVTIVASGAEEFGVIYHEYVHLVLNNTLQDVPLWFNEGLADYYATFEVTPNGKQASLGRLQTQHVLRLREQWLPLATLVGVGHDSPYYNESDKMSVFYAESWALVHYLLLGREGKYAKGAGAFVSALGSGSTLDEASTKALGIPAAALERELRQYVAGEHFVRQVVTFTTRIGAIDQVPVGPLDEAGAHAALGDLLFRMQRPEESRAQIDAALALSPSLPEAHATLGRLLLGAGQREEAATHLEQAAAAADAPWSAQFEYASLLIDGRSAGAVSPGIDAATERALRRTIELQPSFPDAYALLAYMKSQTAAGLPEALTLLQRALTLAPGNDSYWMMAAHLYEARGEIDNARRVAAHLATAAREQSVRDEAADLQSRLEAAARRANDAPVKRASGDASGGTPNFRKPGPDDRRLAGTLVEIQCTTKSPVFVVRSGESESRLGAPGFEAIDFVSYRSDLKGEITCGTQPGHVVIVTYTPGGGGRAPLVVAIEFLPDGWVAR